MNAAEIAKQIGVTKNTPHCLSVEGPRFAHLRKRVALDKWEARSIDTFKLTLGLCIHSPSVPGFGKIVAVAYGIRRSVDSARLCPVAAWKLSERTPYELCELLARIAAETDHANAAEVDEWLQKHAAELAGSA